MVKWVLIAIAVLAGFVGAVVTLIQNLPVSQPDGIIAPQIPLQAPLPKPIEPFELNGFTIQPVAEFFVQARVLSKRKYYDETSPIAAYDLALGWGRMSDQTLLQHLKISQSFRFYFYEFQYPEPAPQQEMSTSSSNMHLIPSSNEIASKIAWTRRGQVVEFSGYLVNVSRSDGLSWNSSRSRNDTGKGACEIVYVTSFGEASKSP